MVLTVSGLTGNMTLDINGGNTIVITTEGTHTVYCLAGSNTALGLRLSGSTNTLFTLDNVSSYEADLTLLLTAQLGTKSVTSSALSIVAGTFTKFVLNFEWQPADVTAGQDLKLYLNGAGSVYVDGISLTQAYDMARLSGFRTGVLGSTLESSIFMIGGVGAPTAGGVWSYITNSDRVYRVGMQDNTYNTSTSIATSMTFSDNTYYNVCELLDKVGTSYIYVNGVSRASSTNPRIVGKVINTSTDYPLRIGTWSIGASVKFKGNMSPMQIIRFTNISQSNFDPTTYKIGQSVTGGGAEEVLRLTFQDGTNIANTLKDYSPMNHTITGVNVDITNRKRVTP